MIELLSVLASPLAAAIAYAAGRIVQRNRDDGHIDAARRYDRACGLLAARDLRLPAAAAAAQLIREYAHRRAALDLDRLLERVRQQDAPQ